MSKFDLIRPFLPEIREPWKTRNQIKSKHIDIHERLRSSDPVRLNFVENNEATLGLATRKHYRVKKLIESNGYFDDGEYIVHDSGEREEIQKLTKSVIWRIRLTNFLSISLWLLFAAVLVILIGVVTTVISRIIVEFVTNWISLAPSQ